MWLTDDPSELIYHRLVKRDAPGMPTVDQDIVLGGSRRVSMLQINGSRGFRNGDQRVFLFYCLTRSFLMASNKSLLS